MAASSSSNGAQQQLQDRHVCHCGKSFIRKEHLRRHQATHGGRAFSCPTCRKSFTRSDLLRRHVSLHEASSAPEPRRGRACDACHANKTKCDGGIQCSLCTRRNITCNYRHQSSAFTQRAMSQASNDDRNSIPADGGSEAPQLLEQEPEVVMDLETQHSQNDTITATVVISFIKKLIDPNSPVGDNFELPREATSWFEKLLDLYWAGFHDAWPIIHGPTFVNHDTPFAVLSSVMTVSLWLEGGDSARYAVKLHETLMKRLFLEISKPVPSTHSWPTQVYSACILSIAFALCHGDSELVSKGMLLHGLLTSALRQVGFFVHENIAYYQQTHHPGNYLPYIQTIRDGCKRIAACLYRLDSYFALIKNQLPCLRREEMDNCLPATFALWSSYGLDVFFKRVPLEPTDRVAVRMWEMMNNAQSPARPVLLIEDVQLGLCGQLSSIWNVSLMRRRGVALMPPGAETEESLAFQLDLWKSELDRLSTQCTNQFLEEKTSEFPFRAYLADEDVGQPSTLAFIRIRALVSSTLMLYHDLYMHLYADIQTLSLVAECLNGAATNTSAARVRKYQGQLHAWALTPQSRRALLHAVAVLQTREAATEQKEASQKSVDPIDGISLATSALVLWAWLTYADAPCSCVSDLNHLDVANADMQDSSRLEAWISTGGTAALNGLALCRCFTRPWMTRFAAVQRQDWKLSQAITPILNVSA